MFLVNSPQSATHSGGGEQSGSQPWRAGVWAGGQTLIIFNKIVPEYQRAARFSFLESISALTSSEKRRTQRPEAISFAPPPLGWCLPFYSSVPAPATNGRPWKMAPAAGGLRSLFVGETIRYRFNRQHSLFLPKCTVIFVIVRPFLKHQNNRSEELPLHRCRRYSFKILKRYNGWWWLSFTLPE